jgi:hypothetical protein
MRRVIKRILAEQLGNSLKMKKEYEEALNKLPAGCLASRNVKGHIYYYLVKRAGKKVKYIYKGKLPEQEVKKFGQIKIMRAKYRNLLSRVKKQISYLRGALRGKEPI